MLVKEMRSSRALTPSKQFQSIDVYKTALEKFSEGKHIDTGTEQAQNINGVGAESSKSNDPLIDEFLELIGYTGRPYFQWELIKPVFLWKLQAVINVMMIEEAEKLGDDVQKDEFINSEAIKETKDFIFEKVKNFTGTPFTIQRLCELLVTPTRHYQATEKFLHALERTINVITTINEDGVRVTGAEEFGPLQPEDDVEPIPVERNFMISVDELDDPLPQPQSPLSTTSKPSSHSPSKSPTDEDDDPSSGKDEDPPSPTVAIITRPVQRQRKTMLSPYMKIQAAKMTDGQIGADNVVPDKKPKIEEEVHQNPASDCDEACVSLSPPQTSNEEHPADPHSSEEVASNDWPQPPLSPHPVDEPMEY